MKKPIVKPSPAQYKKLPINPSGLFTQTFLTFFGRVVSRGNKEPYREEILFRLPAEIRVKNCLKRDCQKLSKRLQNEPLTPILCASLDLKRITLSALSGMTGNTTHTLLPHYLKFLVEWIEETTQGSEYSRSTGYWIVGGIIFSLFVKLYFQTRIKQNDGHSTARIKNILSVSFLICFLALIWI